MDYSQHSISSINDKLSNFCSILEMHVNEMRQRNENADWIENVDSSQYNFFSCVGCGVSHLNEHCPYNTTSAYKGDDFTRNQTCFDHSFSPRWSLEQHESWNPHLEYCPKEITSPFYSYSHVEENTLESKEKSHLESLFEEFMESQEKFRKEQEEFVTSVESRVQNIGVYASQIVSSLEIMTQENSLSMMTTSCCVNDDYCEEEEEDVELQETIGTLGFDCELDINLGESNGCLKEVPAVEPNLCEFDVEVNEIPRVAVYDPPIEVVTLTDESQVDFVGCSKFLKALIFNCKNLKVELSLNLVNACSLKLLMIEGEHVINMNEHLFCLKPCCLKRNEDKVIMVFDTYD